MARDDDLQALAGEYVVGLLAGEERDRVERQMTGDARLRGHVETWQVRLQPLADAVEPVQPSPEAWQRIETTLGSPGALRQRRPLAAQRGPSWWQRINFWRTWAAVATLAAVALAGWIAAGELTLRPGAQRLVALLSSVGGEPFWLLRADSPDQVAVHQVREIARSAQALELWLLPEGKPPVSLGLLDPDGDTDRRLPAELAAELAPGVGLAVTLEPPGGAPSGVATGPITYRGRLVADPG